MNIDKAFSKELKKSGLMKSNLRLNKKEAIKKISQSFFTAGAEHGSKQARIDFAHELHEIGVSDLELADYIDTELEKLRSE